jgi:hypothetical protein
MLGVGLGNGSARVDAERAQYASDAAGVARVTAPAADGRPHAGAGRAVSKLWAMDTNDPGPRPVSPASLGTPTADFVQDVRRAVEVCRATPALPALTTLLAIAIAYSSSAAPAHTLLAFVGLLFIGWVGSERLWFLRAYTGRTLSVRSALRASLHYWPRVICLFLLLGLITVPLSIPIILATVHAGAGSGTRPAHVDLPAWALVYSALLSLMIDFALTFVTPALIYTNRSARTALGIGLRLLRQTWPHAAPYVLIPPLALVILSRLTGDQVSWLGGTVIVISYVLNLIAKGATASYYLRLVAPAGPDGDFDSQLR